MDQNQKRKLMRLGKLTLEDMRKKRQAQLERDEARSANIQALTNERADDVPKHLGGHGYTCHLDKAVFAYLVERFGVGSVIDIGCGTGGMVEYAASQGVKAVGIDGDFSIVRPAGLTYVIHDFTTGPVDVGLSDLAWCVEFLEHVHERYLDNYFAVFKKCRAIFCTASRSLVGHHHVNVKGATYWDEVFGGRGFVKDVEASLYVRDHSGMTKDFVRETGTVWVNTSRVRNMEI